MPNPDALPVNLSDTVSRRLWTISDSGGIESNSNLTNSRSHSDHIEMGGRAVNAIVKWTFEAAGGLNLERIVRWPTVRLALDNTHSSFSYTFPSSDDPRLLVDGLPYSPRSVEKIEINGFLRWLETDGAVSVQRTLFPATSLPCLLEMWEIRNIDDSEHSIRLPGEPHETVLPREMFLWTEHVVRTEWIGESMRVLSSGESIICGLALSCREAGAPPIYPVIQAELAGRIAFRNSTYEKLVLNTPDAAIDRLFKFSKLHSAENVLATRGGLMHAPGGFNSYLAALWCNDENEYASPFFPFLGDAGGCQSAINAYRWFSRYQNDDFQFIPSSIVAEGRGTWQGAGDRGDAAMTAYGAARWAMANGDPDQARSLWPFIQWCLQYCERLKNEYGVIQSDSDELENRFSSGRTNLATSCLTMDAYISASYLAQALEEPETLCREYASKAADLRSAIEAQFGAVIDGYTTYRYHDNLQVLRAWICLPLTVGIFDRAPGTVAALFTSDLWTEDGLLTEPGTQTRWDRGTLFALRGAFAAGFSDEVLENLSMYTTRRLLGEHVPYCVEAFPEGNQSQVSAESALYCRIFTEGIFGIRPTGFCTFECTPRLPSSWSNASLQNIQAFARSWNLELTRTPEGIDVSVTSSSDQQIYRAARPNGATHKINLKASPTPPSK